MKCGMRGYTKNLRSVYSIYSKVCCPTTMWRFNISFTVLFALQEGERDKMQSAPDSQRNKQKFALVQVWGQIEFTHPQPAQQRIQANAKDSKYDTLTLLHFSNTSLLHMLYQSVELRKLPLLWLQVMQVLFPQRDYLPDELFGLQIMRHGWKDEIGDENGGNGKKTKMDEISYDQRLCIRSLNS